MRTYEVVIIGAGPAGLNCAYHLQGEKKVLILEKNKVIGPKVCAGGLFRKDVEYLNLPKNVLDKKFSEVIVTSPWNKAVVKSSRGIIFTVERENLAKWQIKRLKNIKIMTGAEVTKITDKYVVIGDKKIAFKYLLGADGSNSIVRKYLGLKTEVGIGIQYLVKTKKYNHLELHLNSNLFNGFYAWIFPHTNYVSIGSGCNPNFFNVNELKKNLNFWLNIMKIDVSKSKFEAFPISYMYKGHKFGNVFLAGDAAGLASAVSGGGIYQALVSGEEIAHLIMDEDYAPDKLNQIIKQNKKNQRLMKFMRGIGFFRAIIFELIVLSIKFKPLLRKLARWYDAAI